MSTPIRRTHWMAASALALVIALTAPAGAAGATQGPSAEPQRETRTKRLSSAADVGGRTVSVNGSGMQLEVVAGSGDRTTVEAVLEYWSSDDDWMERVEQAYEIGVRETSRRIEFDFGGMPERRSGGLFSRLFNSGSYSWSLEVTVTVPAGTDLTLSNAYGPVEVHDVNGALSIRNSSGAVRVSGTGPVTIDSSYAEVLVEGVDGDVRIDSSSAEVTVSDVEGGVEATTSYAPLTIDNVRGDVEARAGSGSLTVRHVTGAVRTRNTYAGATIEDVGGAIDHETSSGDVEIRRAGGTVRAVGSYGRMQVTGAASAELRNGSGSVTVEQIRGDARVTNSYAPVEARAITGSLVIDSSSAGVRVEDVGGSLEITTSYDGVHVSGVGGAVAIRASSGRVTVEGFRDAALTARHVIETTYAGIEVVWPRTTPLAIDAESTYGGISSEVGGAIEGSGSRHTLKQEAPGAAAMRLVASSGSIQIRAR